MNAIPHASRRVQHVLKRRTLRVARVDQVSPLMRRVTFTGDDLQDFTSDAADDHIKLFFPIATAPGSTVTDVPVHAARDYTPLRFDRQSRELSIEFVLHGHGPAASWAAQATEGQTLVIGGPKGSFVVADDYAHYVLIGDETALPAISRRLLEMPLGTSVTALIEVANAGEERRLATGATATIRWLHRDGAPAGTTTLLDQALKDLTLPDEDVHVWIGAEINTARRLRAALVDEQGMDRANVRAAGYWRLGTENGGARVED